ncbi:hypothetical protein HYZ80_01640 [Candidatus Parcubacteria bacterium]|nr:hypothetical protein [Candidatus Parcubacteria bacterium]
MEDRWGGWEVGRARRIPGFLLKDLRERDGWIPDPPTGDGEGRRAAREASAARTRALEEARQRVSEAEARRAAEAPLVASREAAAAKEAQRQALLKKKELLERKLKEFEGTGREEQVLEWLLKAEEELAAIEKGGE